VKLVRKPSQLLEFDKAGKSGVSRKKISFSPTGFAEIGSTLTGAGALPIFVLGRHHCKLLNLMGLSEFMPPPLVSNQKIFGEN